MIVNDTTFNKRPNEIGIKKKTMNKVYTYTTCTVVRIYGQTCCRYLLSAVHIVLFVLRPLYKIENYEFVKLVNLM